MGRYVKLFLSRLAQFSASLLVLLLISFGLLRFFPGNSFNEERNLDPQVFEKLQDHYGLRKNFLEQFVIYVKRLSQGDLGDSIHYPGRSVGSLIKEFGRTSALLGLLASLVSLAGAFAFSMGSRGFRSLQKKCDFALLVSMSVPTLVLGPLCVWFFGFYLEFLPVAFLEGPMHYLLPVALLAFKPMMSLSRILSTSLDSAMQAPHIRTFRSLGFSEWALVSRYALKNSLVSFLSQSSVIFAGLISGSFLIESLFAIPGLGSQFVDSILNRDWPLILGLTLFYGTLLMALHFLMDLMVLALDPRLKGL